MAAYKWCADTFLDAALEYLQTNGTQLNVLADTGLTAGADVAFSEIAAHTLAVHTLTSGDYTKADGDTSGRKITLAAQASISITASGTAVQVVISNGTNAIYYMTTCSSQALESGGTVTVPAWDIELRAPA